jgi:Flp pilus assembly CpaF family ATPase
MNLLTTIPAWAAGAEDSGLLALRSAPDSAKQLDSALLEQIQAELRQRLPIELLDPFAPAEQRYQAVIAALREAIQQAHASGSALDHLPSDSETLRQIYQQTIGWGPLQRYLDDPRIDEIKIIGSAILVQERGNPFTLASERFEHPDQPLARARLLAALLGVRLDQAHPQATLPLPHGARMHVTIPPLADQGGLICIRRGRQHAWHLSNLLEQGSISTDLAAILRLLIAARCSLLVVGATGSGKTTLLEALANTIPGDTHIITIEDLTREITIQRTALWTRELVDTSSDPLAFGRVAREALRQTPGYLIVGETRGCEAGAILAMANADRPVLTSLHARSCQAALERMALYASLPGGYLYQGRYEEALRDLVNGFDGIIRVDMIANRRVVSEIALTHGCIQQQGVLTPQLRPLAQLNLSHASPTWPTWDVYASATETELRLADRQPLPRALQQKLALLHYSRSTQPTLSLDLADQAHQHAEQALMAGDPLRALQILQAAWPATQAPRLLVLARRVLSYLPQRTMLHEQAQLHLNTCEQLIAQHEWDAADQCFRQCISQVAWAALAEPPQGWAALRQAIYTGRNAAQHADETCQIAERLIEQHQAWAALEQIQPHLQHDLSPALTQRLKTLHETAYQLLVAQGQGNVYVLNALQAQSIPADSASSTS